MPSDDGQSGAGQLPGSAAEQLVRLARPELESRAASTGGSAYLEVATGGGSIAQARRAGISFNCEEHLPDWCGATSAVRDPSGRDIAYLNVTLPSWSTSEEQLHALGPQLLTAAGIVASRLAVAPG